MTFHHFAASIIHRYLRIPYALNVKVFQNPKKAKETYILIHGIGNSLHAWDNVVAKLPKDVQIIGIDLLGFGDSPKPVWAVYDAKTQARSVAITLLRLQLTQRPILVGHSLGALIAIEIAKRYPLFIKEIILCSPPFYSPEVSGAKGLRPTDDMLRGLYRLAKKHPKQLEQLSPLAVKLGLANRALAIREDTVGSYVAALESSIINQTSLKDVARLKLPIMIFYGSFDPVVISKHITQLVKSHPTIRAKKVLAGHEVVGSYATTLAQWMSAQTAAPKRHDA